MKKIVCISLLAGLWYSSVYAQNTSIFDDVSVASKCYKARQLFLGGDVSGALKLYKEAFVAKPKDGSIAYRIGECYFTQGDNDMAVEYLEKAEKEGQDTNSKDDVHLLLGEAYLQTDAIDNAHNEFMIFKQKYSNNPKKLKEADIEHYIAETVTAKDFEAHPVNVKVTNLGDAINTPYDEKSPSVTADGRTLIFTSMRPLQLDKKAKEEPASFENVYISTWDSSANNWKLSYPIDGDINQPYDFTANTSISADGAMIFLYKNNKTNALGGDIFVSRHSRSGRWGKPVTMGKPINSTYYEDGACLSPDGNTLYFVSERPGGYGRGDIYKSEKVSKSSWGEPVNLGPIVNSWYDEGGLSIAPDGKTLFFSSDGHNSMGDYDIFKTVMNDSGKWSVPLNLGYPINTVNKDVSFTISADARTAYFASNRKGGIGGRDIYKVDLSQYAVLGNGNANEKPTGLSILRGKVSDSKGKPVDNVNITISDSAGNKITTVNSNSEGLYFITLKSKFNYKLRVSEKGYKTVTKNFKMPESPVGTFTMLLDILMEKQ
jgi:hypothetical protein